MNDDDTFADLLQHLQRFPSVTAPADLEDRMLARAKSNPPLPQAVTKLEVSLVCTYCHDQLARPDAAFCASCLAPHHHDCFATHGRCATPGCDELELVEPRRARRPRLRPVRWIAAAAALLVAGSSLFMWKVSKPPAWEQTLLPTPIEVAVGEVVRFDYAWAPDDPPEGRRPTALGGEDYVWLPSDYAHVEWAVPDTAGRTVFLIEGKAAGAARFWLRFPNSRRNVGFDVQVVDDPPRTHAGRLAERRARLRALSPRELRGEVEARTAAGERYREHRDLEGKEAYYRDAVLAFAAATDAARALHASSLARGGPGAEPLLEACDRSEEVARRDHAAFVRRTWTDYRRVLSTTDDRDAQRTQLRRLLRAINDPCDLDFMRLELIHELAFGEPFTDPVTPCPADPIGR